MFLQACCSSSVGAHPLASPLLTLRTDRVPFLHQSHLGPGRFDPRAVALRLLNSEKSPFSPSATARICSSEVLDSRAAVATRRVPQFCDPFLDRDKIFACIILCKNVCQSHAQSSCSHAQTDAPLAKRASPQRLLPRRFRSSPVELRQQSTALPGFSARSYPESGDQGLASGRRCPEPVR